MESSVENALVIFETILFCSFIGGSAINVATIFSFEMFG